MLPYVISSRHTRQGREALLLVCDIKVGRLLPLDARPPSQSGLRGLNSLGLYSLNDPSDLVLDVMWKS
jgi:hypothetical protein